MKVELNPVPKLKLRTATDRALVDLSTGIQKAIQRRSFFASFIIYRLITAVTTPLIIALSLLARQYMETGGIAYSITIPEVFLLSIAAAAVMLLIFRIHTSSLRSIVDAVVDNREYGESLAIDAYSRSFSLPVRITAGEFIASSLFLLAPLLIQDLTGLFPSGAGLRGILTAWWLGTMVHILSSFLFLQNWVEKVLMRLYDCGLRFSSWTSHRKKANIYGRIIGLNSMIIITLVLVFASMLGDLSASIPGGISSRHLVQFIFVSVVILVGAEFFFLMVLNSLKRSFNILQKKMKSIQNGDYSVRILNFRDDEIGELYDSFDFMVSTLNRVLGSLEEEVGKRTARIEAINAKLSKYLSPQLYSMIYENEAGVTLSYARKKLTIFFSDIVGFTHISENLAPEDLSRILNQYLDVMAGIALKWGGTIDKYIGDAIMVFFGDPEYTSDRDHAVRCVSMALEMLGKLSALREEWTKAGIPYPLHVRIGINTGFCTVGNFGSENRMDYTVIGGAVNLASRLQTAASEDGILISETTYLLVKDSFACAEVGLMRLKGIDQPVRAYRIAESATGPADAGITELHMEGFDLKVIPGAIGEESRGRIKKALKQAYRLIEGQNRSGG